MNAVFLFCINIRHLDNARDPKRDINKTSSEPATRRLFFSFSFLHPNTISSGNLFFSISPSRIPSDTTCLSTPASCGAKTRGLGSPPGGSSTRTPRPPAESPLDGGRPPSTPRGEAARGPPVGAESEGSTSQGGAEAKRAWAECPEPREAPGGGAASWPETAHWTELSSLGRRSTRSTRSEMVSAGA